jgi:hypothetical protein
MRFKKTLAAVGTAAALAGGMAVALPAIAQDDATTTTTTYGTTLDGTTLDSTATTPSIRGRHGGELSVVSDVLGIDATELRDRLEAGETIADIATAQGVAIDDVVSALVADARERLDTAVADGRLTQAEADEELTEATDRITAMVNGEAPLGELGGRHHGFGPCGFDHDSGAAPIRGVDDTAAETLNA